MKHMQRDNERSCAMTGLNDVLHLHYKHHKTIKSEYKMNQVFSTAGELVFRCYSVVSLKLGKTFDFGESCD